MAIREYLCSYCGHQFDEIVYSSDPDDYATHECRCGSIAKYLPSQPAQARGAFGTVRRTDKSKPQKLNFSNKKES